MYSDLKGKTALITGAGKKTGIGYAIAAKLAENGTHVIIADLGHRDGTDNPVQTGTRSEMETIARELASSHGAQTLAVDLDVTSPKAVAEMINIVKNHFQKIDVLVNNAGAAFGVPADVNTYDEAAWMKTIDVNLHGAFRMSRAVLPLMNGKSGSIINMASRAGKVPPVFNGAYAVAKAGVIMLTKVMALELAGQGIRANALCPGLIKTDMQDWRIGLEAEFFNATFDEREAELSTRVPLGYLGDPENVATLAVFLASRASAYITGQAINVCGGQTMEI